MNKQEVMFEMLFEAIEENNLKDVKALFAMGVVPHIKNSKGLSPLHVATKFNHSKIVNFLVKAGADVNVWDQYFETPLHIAARGNFIEIAEILIEAGAKLETKSSAGYTPLDRASYHFNNKFRGNGPHVYNIIERAIQNPIDELKAQIRKEMKAIKVA
jgi:ankyrin repeat protein